MRNIALLGTAAALAAATSVVGLEHGNVPMPRSRPRPRPVSIDDLNYSVEYAEQAEARAAAQKAELAEHQRKIDAAKAKRARKGEQLKKAAAAGAIGVVEAKVEPVPTEKPKRSRAKKTTTI